MHDQQRGTGAGTSGEAEGGGAGRVSPGRQSLSRKLAARSAARGAAGGAAGGDEPTIHDVATVAVEHKDGGGAVDGGVAGRVGSHLGADFSSVRVHQDPLAQEATAAMGARAFAHGPDVFLGPGESGSDLGLMAHELTHVVQQGAAGQRAPQRKVQVGEANSPAEQQADQVAADVTAGTGRPQSLLVDDGPVGPGQMLKSTFLDQLRQQVTAAADAELGPIYSAIGCPYIDRYFGRYADQPASAAEALIRRLAPATRAARTAGDLFAPVVARVREGVRTWRETGRAPDLGGAEGALPAVTGAATGAARALRAPDGRETLASLEAELGPGQALDGATASRMSGALGVDVSSVRIHADATAARKAAEVGAVAFAAGPNVVLGSGAPAAGTVEGDALLAHELAHTAQQPSGGEPLARLMPLGDRDAAAEAHADAAAAGAVAGLHGERRGLGHLARTIGDSFRTGFQLQRCQDSQPQQQQQQQGVDVTHVSNQITDGPYGWQQEFDVTFSDDEVRVVLKPKLAPGDGVTPEQLADVKQRARTSFLDKFDNKFVLTDTADNHAYNLRTDVEFVDDGEHYTINLLAGNGTSNRRKWYVERPSESFAHELGHQLGLKDEYAADDSPDREVHTDHSIMGDIHGEGRAEAQMHQRHAETIAGEIGGATRRTFTVARRR